MRSKVRARYVGNSNNQYENNTHYDLDIRQNGESFKVKKSEDTDKPFVTLLEFKNLDELLNKFTITFKYIIS